MSNLTESAFTDGEWKRHIDHVYRGWKSDKGPIPIRTWNPAWEYDESERRKAEWAKIFQYEVDKWQKAHDQGVRNGRALEGSKPKRRSESFVDSILGRGRELPLSAKRRIYFEGKL